MDFARRGVSPHTTPILSLEALAKVSSPFFVLTDLSGENNQPDHTIEKTLFDEVAAELRFDTKLYTTDSLEVASAIGSLPGSRGGLTVVREEGASVYTGEVDKDSIIKWAKANRFARLAEMTHELAFTMRRERPMTRMVIGVLNRQSDDGISDTMVR